MFSRLVARRPGALVLRSLPFLILLLALALRLYRLDGQSFDADELLSVWHARVPLDTLISALPVDHTPAYWVMLHYWIAASGDVDFAIRFLSVLWGVLAVALMIPLGARFFSRPVGLAAALLLALDPFAVYYSQEARMYTMLLALSAVSLYLFARAFEKPGSRLLWMLHGVGLAAALYTHYYAAALLIGEITFLLSERKRWSRPVWLGWGTSLAALAILFVPWLPRLARLLRTQAWQPPVDPLTYPVLAWSALIGGATIPEDLLILVFVGSVVLLAAGVVATRSKWQGRLAAALVFAPVGFIVAVLSLRGNGPLYRYLIVLLPPVALLLAASFERARTHGAPLIRAASLVFTSAYLGLAVVSLATAWFDPHFARPDWRAAAAWIEAHEQPGDRILVDGADKVGPFLRYYDGSARFDEMPALQNKTAPQIDAAMSRAIGSAPRVWLILFDREPGVAEDWLNRRGFLGDYEEFAGVYVWPAIVKAELSPATRPSEVDAEAGLTLRSYRAAQVCAGDLLPVSLEWQNGPANQQESLQVSLRLLAKQGRLLTAMDRTPRFGLYPTTAWQPGQVIRDNYALMVPNDLTPGDYELAALLYSPADGEPVLRADLGRVRICAAGSPERKS